MKHGQERTGWFSTKRPRSILHCWHLPLFPVCLWPHFPESWFYFRWSVLLVKVTSSLFWSLLPKTFHVEPPLSTQASQCLWLLDSVPLLLRLFWDNSYSFFKAHQNPSSTRKPFFFYLPTFLPSCHRDFCCVLGLSCQHKQGRWTVWGRRSQETPHSASPAPKAV